MKLAVALCLAFEVGASRSRNNGKNSPKRQQKKKGNANRISSRGDKMMNCRFWGSDLTSSTGELLGRPGEILSQQCWPIRTTCEHGIELSFSARNFRDVCYNLDNNGTPEFELHIHYEDEDLPKSFNLCDQELPPETDAHGEWIYLNGSSAALVEYQAPSFDYEPNFKLKWQCFGMASSVWRRYIGAGWESIIESQQDMQERFKIKLHRIVTKLMLQITMKDKCLSEPSLSVLKRIEASKDIDQWVQNVIRLIKQRFSTCRPSLADDDIDKKELRQIEFTQSKGEHLKQKAETLVEKFEKYASAPSQDLVDTRRARRLRRQ